MIPDPNETRDKILEAAIEVFNQKNYGDTSVNNITEVAGTSHGTFYIYFKNKRDALMELIKQVLVCSEFAGHAERFYNKE